MILLSDLLEDDSQAAQQAKRMGLVYKRFGRWADPRTDKVTHYTKDGMLRKVAGGELEAPAMVQRRRPLRKRPSRGREPTKTPTPDKKQSVVPIEQKKTKEDPSFEELSKAAEEHSYTVISKDRIESIRSVPSSKQPESEWKPNGFWFGVRDSWIDWMEEEAPHWKGDNLYSLDIDESKCLVIETNEQFLEFSKSIGNDLSTPHPEFQFPGVKPGDRWCLCALRWKQAYDNGMAPPVFLDSTHIETLKFIDLNILKQFTLN